MCLQSYYSIVKEQNRLSAMVEVNGIEPMASCVQSIHQLPLISSPLTHNETPFSYETVNEPR